VTDPTIRIRRAAVGDAAAIAEFGARTFVDAFGADNNPDDLARHLATTYNREQQTVEINDATYVTLVAEVDGSLAGFGQVRRHAAPPCVVGPEPVELHRFYVDRPWHGTGVAQRLMTEVHRAAAALGGRTIWLSTWDRNARGLAFYAKCGFVDVGGADFWVGNDRQTDRILSIATT